MLTVVEGLKHAEMKDEYVFIVFDYVGYFLKL